MAGRGRIIPYELAKVRGFPSKNKMTPPPQPSRTEAVPEPPSHLPQAAREEWWRVAPELHRLGLLTTLDLMTFAVYCTAVARWLRLEAELADEEFVVPGARTERVLVTNPRAKLAVHAARDVVNFSAAFGMSPAARTRMVAGLNVEEPSKFGDLLA
jgi:P27 family predicted phage terminase small subunit